MSTAMWLGLGNKVQVSSWKLLCDFQYHTAVSIIIAMELSYLDLVWLDKEKRCFQNLSTCSSKHSAYRYVVSISGWNIIAEPNYKD